LSFVILRRPPTPPLFPYTTLFRSDDVRRPEAARHLELGRLQVDGDHAGRAREPRTLDGVEADATAADHGDCVARPDAGRVDGGRSEEHTSELQSRENLVCRLLLEK